MNHSNVASQRKYVKYYSWCLHSEHENNWLNVPKRMPCIKHTYKILGSLFLCIHILFFFILFASHTKTSKLIFTVARQTAVLKSAPHYTCSATIFLHFTLERIQHRRALSVCASHSLCALYRHNGICSMMHFCCLIFIITIITDFVMHVPRFSINSTTRQGELKVIGVLCCSKKWSIGQERACWLVVWVLISLALCVPLVLTSCWEGRDACVLWWGAQAVKFSLSATV